MNNDQTHRVILPFKKLTKTSEFHFANRRGAKFHSSSFLCCHVSNNKSFNGFGIIVSRKVGNAVVRNRIKRRIREAIRSISRKEHNGENSGSKYGHGISCVLIPNSKVANMNWLDLVSDLRLCVTSAIGLWSKKRNYGAKT